MHSSSHSTFFATGVIAITQLTSLDVSRIIDLLILSEEAMIQENNSDRQVTCKSMPSDDNNVDYNTITNA